jgi:hypothetical protein
MGDFIHLGVLYLGEQRFALSLATVGGIVRAVEVAPVLQFITNSDRPVANVPGPYILSA